MLRSHKLTGMLYIGIGVVSAVVAIVSGHDALGGVGIVFLCIGAALLANGAGTTSNDPGACDGTGTDRHGHGLKL